MTIEFMIIVPPADATGSFRCSWQLQILFERISWSWCLYYFVVLICGITLWVCACAHCLCRCCCVLCINQLCMIYDLECQNIFFHLIYLNSYCFFLTLPFKPCKVSPTYSTETALLPLPCLLNLLCWCCWCRLWGQELFLHYYSLFFGIVLVLYLF